MLTGSELRLRAVALAESLLSLMRWWLDCGSKESPQAMDKLVHQMVCNGLRQDSTASKELPDASNRH